MVLSGEILKCLFMILKSKRLNLETLWYLLYYKRHISLLLSLLLIFIRYEKVLPNARE